MEMELTRSTKSIDSEVTYRGRTFSRYSHTRLNSSEVEIGWYEKDNDHPIKTTDPELYDELEKNFRFFKDSVS